MPKMTRRPRPMRRRRPTRHRLIPPRRLPMPRPRLDRDRGAVRAAAVETAVLTDSIRHRRHAATVQTGTVRGAAGMADREAISVLTVDRAWTVQWGRTVRAAPVCARLPRRRPRGLRT